MGRALVSSEYGSISEEQLPLRRFSWQGNGLVLVESASLNAPAELRVFGDYFFLHSSKALAISLTRFCCCVARSWSSVRSVSRL